MRARLDVVQFKGHREGEGWRVAQEGSLTSPPDALPWEMSGIGEPR
jgi:hypothetical protein